MSTTSHKKSKKDFDVLEDQDVQTKEDKNMHHVKLHRVHEKANAESSTTKKTELHISPFAKVTDFVKKDSKKDEEFKSAMKDVLHYVKGLKNSKGAKILAFDLSVYDSINDYESVVETVSNAVTRGAISKNEELEIKNLLTNFSDNNNTNEEEDVAVSEDEEFFPAEELDEYIGVEKIIQRIHFLWLERNIF